MGSQRARLELTHNRKIAKVLLAAPKANILDRAMMRDIAEIMSGPLLSLNPKAIVVTGEGPNFSFGASVGEHLPGEIEPTLSELRGLLILMAKAPAPTIAAVRGQCLGGGFELALACDLIAAEDIAQFACPEIKLGVFPPAAAALLPVRAGSSWANTIILTGNAFSGRELAAAGLVSRLAATGELDHELDIWLESDFIPRSTAALRHAATAARLPVRRALEDDLPLLEKLYLETLMREADAIEGIRAFLEKRAPQWSGSDSVEREPASEAGKVSQPISRHIGAKLV